MSLASSAVCFPGESAWATQLLNLLNEDMAGSGWLEMGSLEWRGEKVPRVRFLLLNIVELDLQHSIMWYLDAGRGVKYRIPPFGILEGLYNVLFLFTAGREWIGCLEDWSGSSAPFKAKSTKHPDPSAYSGRSVTHVCKGRRLFEPEDLLGSEILLILWFYK